MKDIDKTPRIEEIVEELLPTNFIEYDPVVDDEVVNIKKLKQALTKALTEAHQAGDKDGYERGKQAMIEESEVEVRDSMCEFWYQKGKDEAVEKRPDEPTSWVSEPMTQKEAEIYVQGMYDLMMMVGCDGHCKHYDPLFFEGDIAHSYVLELDDGGRHHSYVTPQWVALKALLEFAQTLKDEWEIGGWNEYFAENTRKAIEEIEALQDNK